MNNINNIRKGFNGCFTPRFTNAGIHPNSIEKGKLGIPSIDAKLGPGRYDLSYVACFDEKKQDRGNMNSDWHRALFLEEQGNIPHFMSKYLYKEKDEQKRRMGPGKYDFKDFLQDNNKKNSASCMKSRLCRFIEAKKDSFPGPGTYGKDGIPCQIKYEADLRRKHCNTVGLLKRGGKSGRNFFNNIENIGPGIYKIDCEIDKALLKRTGNRNIYDCNSEIKLEPLKYGHRAIWPSHKLGPGAYQYKEFITELNDRFHKFKGKFLTAKQYPPKPHERVFYIDAANTPPDPKNQVSAVSYFPRHISQRKCESFGGKKYPFNFSAPRVDKRALLNFGGDRTPFTGPGRYDINKQDVRKHTGGAISAFKSTLQKLDTEEKVNIVRERNRGRNLLINKDSFIDHLPTEKSVCVQNIQQFKNSIRLH